MKYRLGDICTITKGVTGIMKAIPGPYTMIALGETDKIHNEFQFDTKAVIIPLVSSTGHGHASMKRVKYCEGKFALGNILCAVIPKDENFVLAKYLHIYLHWNREELLVSQMKGMANVSLPMNRIADVMVTVPCIEKQREIIELEKKLVDKELEADKLFADQLTQLENLNQAILQEALQGKLVKQYPKDEPASELLKRIKAVKAKSGKKEKPLPSIKPEEIPFKIPTNWVWCRLGEIIDMIYGDSLTKAQCIEGADYPVFGSNGIVGFFNKFLTDKRTVIVGRKGSAGALNICHTPSWTTDVAYYIEESELLNFDFTYFLLKSLKLEELGKGIKPGVNRNEAYNIPIPLPPLSEQKRIVAEIEKQFAKTKQLKEHIIANQQATEQLLKALLHQAFEVRKMEETAEKPKGKIIELPKLQEKEDSHFVKRKVLATYIINQSLNDRQFGDVKFEKLLYLSDYFAIKRNFGQKYYKKVAGPLDNSFTIPFFQQIEKSKWFSRQKSGRQFVFSAGVNHNKSLNTYGYFSDEELSKVDRIINFFKKYDYEQPEIVSTLYAVWNNRLIIGQRIETETLINDFYDWDEAKRKYSKERLVKAIEWMTKENIIPDGWGGYIDKPKSEKK